MRARAVFVRITLVCLGIPLSTAMVYALVVPAFLGGDETSREALTFVTAVVALLLLATVGALPLRYLGAILAASRRKTTEEHRAKLYAAPREGAAVLALAALAVLGSGLAPWGTSLPHNTRAVAALVGAAAVMIASLTFYPLMRLALRPVVQGLPVADGSTRVGLGDRLAVRVGLAVAVPSGMSALLAALMVASHVAETGYSEDDLSARVFSLALGVRRLPGEGADARVLAARVLAAGGARVTPGVEFPQVENGPPDVPSPVWTLPMALVLAGIGALLGVRIGRRAARELDQSARRVESVGPHGMLRMSWVEGLAGVLSLPEVRAMATALDRVTESLAEMAADQRRAVTARAEAARLRSFVLAGVSHDLRGPLNSVLGFAGLLLSGVDGDITDGQRESLEALQRGGRDLLRLVDDLLDAARLDAGRMVPERARVQVGELLTQARRAALERVAGGATESVCLPAEGDMDMDAVVDRERVAHALGALLAYALLRPGASPLGGTAGAQVTMKVRSNPGESAWTLIIVGHGTTPSREALGRLFDPFDTPPSGARAPAGLGLAVGVARRVIELHGGSALAEPAPEGGLLFRVVLPRLSHSTPVPSVPDAGDVGDGAR